MKERAEGQRDTERAGHSSSRESISRYNGGQLVECSGFELRFSSREHNLKSRLVLGCTLASTSSYCSREIKR